LSFLQEEVSFLPKRQRFHPQRVWSKTNPGPGLLSRFSPKGSRQVWMVEAWEAAKSGNGYIGTAKFVPQDASATTEATDADDFLSAVG
jgi:hypothetical protein